MNAADSASLHVFVLVGLRAAGEVGRTEERLLLDARREGFTELTAPELKSELRQLADRAWLTPYHPPLGDQRWRLTARGLSALEEQGI